VKIFADAFRIISFALVLLFSVSGNLQAEGDRVRQALIIGNADYQGIPELQNSVNDALLMDKTLKARGFETTLVTNTTKRQMREAIQQFAKRLDRDSVGLFYFAGHGLEVKGRNYLVPVDASIESAADVEYEAVDAGRILSIFKMANNGLNLMILDACRDDPFTKHSTRSIERSGLAPMRPATGSLVLYATEPGSVASDNVGEHNGLFTKSLVESIKQPGLKIEDVFKKTAIKVREESASKQTPYLEGVILGDFIFTKDRTSTVQNEGSGSLTVRTVPSGTTVFVDGVESGLSPTRIGGLGKGMYEIKVSRAGYITEMQRIQLSAGENKKLSITLSSAGTSAAESVPQGGSPSAIGAALNPFTITTHPRTARVRILNIIPVYRAGMQLGPGKYRVEVSASGYKTQTRYVRHRDRSTISHFKLTKRQTVVASSSAAIDDRVVVNSTTVVEPDVVIDRSSISGRTDELSLWNEAKNSKSAEGYRKYLKAFPEGTWSMVANMRLEMLEN